MGVMGVVGVMDDDVGGWLVEVGDGWWKKKVGERKKSLVWRKSFGGRKKFGGKKKVWWKKKKLGEEKKVGERKKSWEKEKKVGRRKKSWGCNIVTSTHDEVQNFFLDLAKPNRVTIRCYDYV